MRSNRSELRSDAGAALITVMMLLALLMMMGLGMVATTSSDMVINAYYQNFRGSFYAADSGIHIARQHLINQMLAGVPEVVAPGTPPLPAGLAADAQASVLAAYGATPFYLRPGPWSGRFRITAVDFSSVMMGDPPQPFQVTSFDEFGNPTGFQYLFNYSVVSEGRAAMGGRSDIEESGTLVLNTLVTPDGPMQISFAAWGMFIDQYEVCSGSQLVPGTITGPVFTNGGWTFGTTGSYTFTDSIGSVSPNFGYQFSASGCGCQQSPNTSRTCSSQTIAPNFQAAVQTGENPIPLPTNDFSQMRAVLDGLGEDSSPVTSAQKNAVLKRPTASGSTAYPAGGATTGVFMPWTNVGGVPTVTGGGIYVEGNASVVMSTVGNNIQRFQITQGSTTSTISIDLVNNTTTFTTGSNTQVLAGVPTNYLNTPPTPATMLYVNGTLSSLRGPAQGQAAVQDGAAITVTAKNDITITGDLIYKQRPVTVAQNEIPGAPAGTLIPQNDKGQLLGVFTAGGDIILDNNYANKTLEIHASLATIAEGGDGGVRNIGTGSADRIDTLTILGGRIQNEIMNINSTTRNVYFDRRFSQPGVAPPWFPSTTYTPPVASATVSVTPSAQRTRWVNHTGN